MKGRRRWLGRQVVRHVRPTTSRAPADLVGNCTYLERHKESTNPLCICIFVFIWVHLCLCFCSCVFVFLSTAPQMLLITFVNLLLVPLCMIPSTRVESYDFSAQTNQFHGTSLAGASVGVLLSCVTHFYSNVHHRTHEQHTRCILLQIPKLYVIVVVVAVVDNVWEFVTQPISMLATAAKSPSTKTGSLWSELWLRSSRRTLTFVEIRICLSTKYLWCERYQICFRQIEGLLPAAQFMVNSCFYETLKPLQIGN